MMTFIVSFACFSTITIIALILGKLSKSFLRPLQKGKSRVSEVKKCSKMTSAFENSISLATPCVYPKMCGQKNDWTSNIQYNHDPWGYMGYQQNYSALCVVNNEEVKSCLSPLRNYNEGVTMQMRKFNENVTDVNVNNMNGSVNELKNKDEDFYEVRNREKGKNNNVYKHIPHKNKPPQVVAKRNARERRRVQAVNKAFLKLRQAVPIENKRGKRISKVKTLHYAIEYIQILQRILEADDNRRCVITNEYTTNGYITNKSTMCQNMYFEGFHPCNMP